MLAEEYIDKYNKPKALVITLGLLKQTKLSIKK